MLLATLVLLLPVPQPDDNTKAAEILVAAERPAPALPASSDAVKDPAFASTLPTAPAPKVKTDAEALAADPLAANPAPMPFVPVKPAILRPRETPAQRKAWYALAFAGHSGAAFDAWSTRRAISGGYGTESNPMLRPFAHSNAIYAVTQVSPALMDFLGKRMMVSQHQWMRRIWWLPQSAGATFSFAAGAHNVSVVP